MPDFGVSVFVSACACPVTVAVAAAAVAPGPRPALAECAPGPGPGPVCGLLSLSLSVSLSLPLLSFSLALLSLLLFLSLPSSVTHPLVFFSFLSLRRTQQTRNQPHRTLTTSPRASAVSSFVRTRLCPRTSMAPSSARKTDRCASPTRVSLVYSML